MTAIFSMCAFSAAVSGALGFAVRDPRDRLGNVFVGGFAMSLSLLFALAALSA